MLTVRAAPRRISQGSTPFSRRPYTHPTPAEGKRLGAQGPPAQTAPPGALGGRLNPILRFAPERGLWAVLRPLRPRLGPFAPRGRPTMTPMGSLRRPLRGAPRERPSSPPGSHRSFRFFKLPAGSGQNLDFRETSDFFRSFPMKINKINIYFPSIQ